MGEKVFKFNKILCRRFGQKIRTLRVAKNWKQDELAFHSNISPSYLSAIERGITDTTISTAKRLAVALDIELAELFIF